MKNTCESVQNYCFPLLRMQICHFLFLLIVVIKCELVKYEKEKYEFKNEQAMANLKKTKKKRTKTQKLEYDKYANCPLPDFFRDIQNYRIHS